jgi:hypothetical protein
VTGLAWAAAFGITTNTSVMAWLLVTAYQLRGEISGTHARHDAEIKALQQGQARIERLFE